MWRMPCGSQKRSMRKPLKSMQLRSQLSKWLRSWDIYVMLWPWGTQCGPIHPAKQRWSSRSFGLRPKFCRLEGMMAGSSSVLSSSKDQGALFVGTEKCSGLCIIIAYYCHIIRLFEGYIMGYIYIYKYTIHINFGTFIDLRFLFCSLVFLLFSFLLFHLFQFFSFFTSQLFCFSLLWLCALLSYLRSSDSLVFCFAFIFVSAFDFTYKISCCGIHFPRQPTAACASHSSLLHFVSDSKILNNIPLAFHVWNHCRL